MAVVEDRPDRLGEFRVFADIICDFARSYHSREWLDYDTAFRSEVSHDLTKRWDATDNQLWAAWTADPLSDRCL